MRSWTRAWPRLYWSRAALRSPSAASSRPGENRPSGVVSHPRSGFQARSGVLSFALQRGDHPPALQLPQEHTAPRHSRGRVPRLWHRSEGRLRVVEVGQGAPLAVKRRLLFRRSCPRLSISAILSASTASAAFVSPRFSAAALHFSRLPPECRWLPRCLFRWCFRLFRARLDPSPCAASFASQRWSSSSFNSSLCI